MRKALYCLTVLCPLGCSDSADTQSATGGMASTTRTSSSEATGGSTATKGETTSRGGTSSTTAIVTGDGGNDATGGVRTTASAPKGGGGSATLSSSGGGTATGGTKATSGSTRTAGGSSAGGTSATGGSIAAAGTTGSSEVTCGMPAAGSSGVAKPAGTVGGFKVIDWAGFKGAVSFTFDDGNTSQLDNYTTLNNLGVYYTFFLIGSNATSNKSKWQQAVTDGHELGNHTQYHKQNDPTGSNVALGQQTIESTYNVKVYTMAAPFGNDYSSIAPNYHFLNRGVSNGLMLPNNDGSAFNTSCFIPALGAKTAAFDTEVNAARSGNGWKVILVHGFTGDSGAYNPVDVDQFTQAVKNAKSPGDLWVDTFANVGAYWRGQAAVSKVQAKTSGSDQTWTWILPAHFPPGRCLRVSVTGGTLKQNGTALSWNTHGYYELQLDAGSVTLSP